MPGLVFCKCFAIGKRVDNKSIRRVDVRVLVCACWCEGIDVLLLSRWKNVFKWNANLISFTKCVSVSDAVCFLGFLIWNVWRVSLTQSSRLFFFSLSLFFFTNFFFVLLFCEFDLCLCLHFVTFFFLYFFHVSMPRVCFFFSRDLFVKLDLDLQKMVRSKKKFAMNVRFTLINAQQHTKRCQLYHNSYLRVAPGSCTCSLLTYLFTSISFQMQNTSLK